MLAILVCREVPMAEIEGSKSLRDEDLVVVAFACTYCAYTAAGSRGSAAANLSCPGADYSGSMLRVGWMRHCFCGPLPRVPTRFLSPVVI